MVIVSSDKILIKKSKDGNNNLNSILESILETSAAVKFIAVLIGLLDLLLAS